MKKSNGGVLFTILNLCIKFFAQPFDHHFESNF